MKNSDDLLKRILMNMKYDSRKTLSENEENITNLITEQAQGPTPGSRGIFDDSPDPKYLEQQKEYEKNKPKVLTPEQKLDKAKRCGHTNWENYKNSNWKCTAGPLTDKTSIKNFQDWYLTQKEKAKSNTNGLYTTKLCSKPCTKGQAVDGVFGENTKKLWKEHFFEYKGTIGSSLYNVNLPIKFDWDEFVAEDKKKEIFNNMDPKTKEYLAKVFRFTIQNPSGWNYVDKIPKATTGLNKLVKFQAAEAPYYKGWNLLNNIFPSPRKYTQEELKVLYNATGGDKLYKEKLKEKAVEDAKLQYKWGLYDKTSVKSDYLGYDRYVADPSGIGLTKKQKDFKEHEDEWKEKLEPYKNKIYNGAVEWNKYIDKVNGELQKKCSRPIRFCSKVNINGTMKETSNCVYLSYSDICKNAGGIWVYNVGENSAWCGCRSMNDPELANTNSKNYSMFQFNGPNGPITANITFGGMLPYNTPETGGKDVKAREAEHNVLFAVEMALTVASFLPTPLSPLFMGAAAVVGFADGVKYYQEGDTHMGVMMMALSLLGAGDLVKAFKFVNAELKAIKVIKEFGTDGVKRLAKASVETPQILTATDKAAVQSLKEAVYVSQKTLGREMSEKIVKNFSENIVKVAKEQKWGWREFAEIFYNFKDQNPTFKGMLIYMGGVPYTIDQIYLALYGNDNDRQRSGIASLIDYLSNNPAEKEKALNEAWLKFQAMVAIDQDMAKSLENFALQLKTMIGPDGKLDTSKLESNEAMLERLRKEGKIDYGFNEERYNKIITDRANAEKEIREKENCEKYKHLLEIGWIELNKIDFVKKKQSKTEKDEDLQLVDCNGQKFLLNRTKEKIESSYPKTMSGQSPINKTMLDNPNL